MSAIHVRRIRLGAALVLLTYLILHFSNHALGIISLDAMAAGRWWFLALWRSVPGTLALYGAIAVHGVLALWLLYQRRTLRMPAWEATQYALGLMLPALLVVHVVGTRIAWWRLGADDPYARIVLALWVLAPELRRPPVAHAGAGVDRTRASACISGSASGPWYPRRAPLALRGCAAAPDAGPAGLRRRRPRGVRAGAYPGLDRGGAPRGQGADGAPRPHDWSRIRETFLTAYLLALLAVLLARGVRRILEWRRAVRITYPVGPRRGRAGRLHHPGRQPDGRHPARLGVRRPRALLDLSRANRRAAWRSCRRPARPSGACWRASAPPPTSGSPARPGRPATWRSMPLLAPSVAPDRRVRHRRPAGPRAGAGRALRRPARLHAHGRAQAAVRRRLLPQPLLRGGGHRDHRRGRRDQPVHRRRRDGAVRDRDRGRRWARARRWRRRAPWWRAWPR